MSRFDDLRQKVGVEPTSTKGSKPTLKTPNFSTRSVTPASEIPQAAAPEANPNARPVRPTRFLPSVPSFNVGNSPLIQAINEDRLTTYQKQLDTMQAEDNPAHFTTDRNAMLGVKARNIPVLKQILTGGTLPLVGWHVGGLDDFATNPTVNKVADTARSFYIPGAGVGEIGALTGAAERGIARAFPKLASTAAGKLGQKVATEAIVGAPLGAAGTQMMNPDASIKDLAKGAALGAGLGAALPVAGSGISRLRQLAKNAANDVTENALRNVANTTRSAVKSPFVQGAAENPIARGYTEEVGKTFGNAPKASIEATPRTVQQLRELAQQKQAAEPTATPVQETAKPAPLQTVSTSEAPTPVPNERSTFTTMRESGKLSPEVQAGLDASPTRTYEPITNVDTVNSANQRVGKNLDEAEAYVLSNSKEFDADRVATGFRLIDEFQKSGNIQRAVTVAEQLAEKLTKAGQTVQAASIWNRLTPEGALLAATRKAKNIGKTLAPADADKITEFANIVQKSGQSVERVSNVQEIAAKLKKGEKLSDSELSELTNFVEDAKSMLGESKPPRQAKQPRLPSDKKVREQLLASLDSKEEALKEFIRVNSRRMSSTPLDIWGAYAALGAVKLAKGAISFSKWSQSMIEDIGEGVRPHLAQLFDRAQQEAAQLERMLPSKTGAEKVAQKYIDAGKLSVKDATLVHDLATRIGKMNTADKQAASREMQGILNKYEKSSIEDKINAVRYIAMLGNTMTQLTNMISSPLMLLERQILEMVQTPFDIARSAMTGGPRRVTFKQGPSVWNNFFSPVMDYGKGAKVGGESAWKGIDPNGITTQNDIRGLAFKSKFNPLSWAERSLGAVMKGADNGAYNAAVQSRLRKMAYLDALNKGIKGEANQRAYMDRYLNNVDANIMELADKFGKEITFQSKTKASEGAQKLVRGANLFSTLGMSDKIGIGSALLPFVKTPTNILMAGLERSPAGLLKGIYELATMAKNPNITRAQVADTFTKAIVGTTGLTGTGYVLGNLGIMTGDSASKDKNVQALEADVGKGKFKFNTTAFARMLGALVSGNMDEVKEVSKYREGDKQLNYNRLQPFAFSASMGATFAEQQKQGEAMKAHGGELPLSSQIGSSLSSAGQSLFDLSLLKGLKDAFDTQPGEGVGDIGKRIVQNYAKSFSPSLLGQETRRQDEAQRNVTYEGGIAPVKQYFQSRLPGQSEKLSPKVTNMGEVKRNEAGIIANYLNPLQSTDTQYNKASQVIYDLIQKTGDEKLAPAPFDKSIRGKKGNESVTIKLTPERLAKAQQEVGKEISIQILRIPQGLSAESKAKRVEQIYTDVRDKQRTKLKRELGIR